jgi:phospholipid-binding lipoprotein MlaA
MRRREVLPVLLGLGACATGNEPTTNDPNDPWERSNRRALDFNLALDDSVIRPTAEVYRVLLPEWLRTRIRNFLNNLEEPTMAANAILQARFLDAGRSVMRLFINTTAGAVGLFDVATAEGIAPVRADFGQTLYSWGVPDGPYLVLPLVAPNNVRDMVGSIVDTFGSPAGIATSFAFAEVTAQLIGIGRGMLGSLDFRAENLDELEALRRDSIDFYARLRSVIRQRRNAELGRAAETGQGLEVLDDPGADPAPAGSAPAAGAAWRPSIPRVTAPEGWARQVLSEGGPRVAALPPGMRADPGWVRQALQSGLLN